MYVQYRIGQLNQNNGVGAYKAPCKQEKHSRYRTFFSDSDPKKLNVSLLTVVESSSSAMVVATAMAECLNSCELLLVKTEDEN